MPGEAERYKPFRVDEESQLKLAREKAAEYGVEEGKYTTGRAGDGLVHRSAPASGGELLRSEAKVSHRAQIIRSNYRGSSHDELTGRMAHGAKTSPSREPQRTVQQAAQKPLSTAWQPPRADRGGAAENVPGTGTRSGASRFTARAKGGSGHFRSQAAATAVRSRSGSWQTVFREAKKEARASQRSRSLVGLAAAETLRQSGGDEMTAGTVSSLLRTPSTARQIGHGAIDTAKFGIKTPARVVRGTVRTAKNAAKAPKKIYSFIRSPAARKQQLHIARQRIQAFFRRRVRSGLTRIGLKLLPMILLGAALVLVPVIALIGELPAVSLKSTDEELNKVYLYITQLDAELTREIHMLPRSAAFMSVEPENVHYYINGSTVNPDFQLKTDADFILRYLDAKYGDYAFDKLIYGLFGGTNVKSELQAIHKSLYSYSASLWTEEIVEEPPPGDGEIVVQGFVGYDPEPTPTPAPKTVIHLDIHVAVKNFETDARELLTESELETMEALDSVGAYTTKVELRNPLESKALWFISRRWGMWCDGTSVEMHDGIDIRQRAGAPVSCVKTGVVTAIGDAGEHVGYSVRVRSGEGEVVYGGLSADTPVSVGQTLSVGSPIGTVGSAGVLHLELWKNGKSVNPLFYLDGYYRSQGITGPGGQFTQAQQDIMEMALAVYENPGLLGDPESHEGAYYGCAAFVANVYWAAGYEDEGRDAINYWSDWQESGGQSRSVIPVGALVVTAAGGEDGSKYGHVGIYIGGGEVIHFSGRVWKHSLASFLSFVGGDNAVTVNQGQVYIGYQGWVWPNGIPLGTYADETGC